MAFTEQDAEIARSGEDQVARRALKKLHQWPHSRRSHFAHAGGAVLARDLRAGASVLADAGGPFPQIFIDAWSSVGSC